MQELLANLRRFLGQLAEAWKALPPSRKLVLTLSGVAVMAALGGFVWYMNQVAYRPLFTDLNETEAAAVVERLQQLEAPYRLASGGRTVLAPEERIDELRLAMAAQGLPRTGRLGFELFDESNFGLTEFAEQVNFRRALEGEVERTITSLEEIKQARVHISLPRRSVFLDDEEPGKASVVVELEIGRDLGDEQTRAIARLTASAVEGLDPERVVVMDTLGRLYSQRYGDGVQLTDQQLDYRRKIEQATVRKIIDSVEPYLGPGGVRVNVVVDVDWDNGEQTEEILDSQPVALTTQITEEITNDIQPVGTPGTAANLPRTPAPPEAQGVRDSRRMETTNYQTSRTVTKLNLERGDVQRMSIAVLVDHRVEVDEEQRKLIRVPRKPEELATIRELVYAASGADEVRGDVVTVQSLPFTILEPPPTLPEPPADPADQILTLEWLERYRNHLILGAVGLVLLFAFVSWFRQNRKKAKVRAERLAAITAEQERKELEEAEHVEIEKRRLEEERMLKGLKLAPVQTSKTQVLKKHLESVANDDPQLFARLMQTWIHEDD